MGEQAPALKIGQVLRKTSAGSLHACNDALQARRLGEAAAVIVKGVGNILVAHGGHAPKRWRAWRIPAVIDPHQLCPRVLAPCRRMGDFRRLWYCSYLPSMRTRVAYMPPGLILSSTATSRTTWPHGDTCQALGGHANNRCHFSVCMQLVFTPGSFSAAMSTHYADTHQQQKHDDESVMLELGAKR